MSSFNTKKFIKNCTVVSPMTVALFSNAMRFPQDSADKTGILKKKITFSHKELFLNKPFVIDNSDCDSDEENDILPEEKLEVLNLDGWTSFVGSSDDISKIFNMRLCLTLAYREFLKNKMISQHSVIIILNFMSLNILYSIFYSYSNFVKLFFVAF